MDPISLVIVALLFSAVWAVVVIWFDGWNFRKKTLFARVTYLVSFPALVVFISVTTAFFYVKLLYLWLKTAGRAERETTEHEIEESKDLGWDILRLPIEAFTRSRKR